VDYEPYTGSHVLTQLQLLMFSALAFSVLMRTGVYPPELRLINLDFDWTYRHLLAKAAGGLSKAIGGMVAAVEAGGASLWSRTQAGARSLHGPRGYFGRTWASGAMGFGVMALLLAFLVSYYVF
jgi:multicomponent Na+:H+ antiporter subunit D